MFQRSIHSLSTRLAYLFIISLFFVTAQEAVAQDSEPEAVDGPTVGVQGGRYGIGFASSWPAYGISGTLQISEKLTAEAVLGLLGAVSNIGGRVWYRFKRNPDYDLYGYGAAGLYMYDGIDNESVLGLGAGVGVEAGLGRLLNEEDFPPIFLNAEIGLAYANFNYYGNFSSLTFGSGIHYRFGGN